VHLAELFNIAAAVGADVGVGVGAILAHRVVTFLADAGGVVVQFVVAFFAVHILPR
jgi:hypothetical protein